MTVLLARDADARIDRIAAGTVIVAVLPLVTTAGLTENPIVVLLRPSRKFSERAKLPIGFVGADGEVSGCMQMQDFRRLECQSRQLQKCGFQACSSYDPKLHRVS